MKTLNPFQLDKAMANSTNQWHLKTLQGLHKGARTVLPAGQLVLIGSDPQCDIVLADDGVAPRHLAVIANLSSIELRALDGMLTVNETRLTSGSSHIVVDESVLGLVATQVSLGIGVEADGIDANITSETRGSSAAEPSLTNSRAAKENGLLPNWRRSVGIVGVLALVGGIAAFASTSLATLPIASGESRIELALLLSDLGMNQSVQIAELGGRLTLRGIASRDQRVTLEERLRRQQWSVDMQLITPDRLVSAVQDVFRTNGVKAKIRHVNDARVEVAGVDPSDPAVRSAAESARRDVSALKSLHFAPYRPPANPPAKLRSVTDAGKQFSAIVGGLSPYVITADNTRYLVGAVLPDGRIVKGIDSRGMTLEHNGTTTVVPF